MNRLFAASLVSSIVCQVVPLFAAPPGPRPDAVDHIADALQKWSDTVQNLKMKIEMKRVRSGGQSEAGNNIVSGFHWTWSKDGRFRLFEWKHAKGKYVSDRLMTFDGRHYYTIKKPHGDPPTNLDDIVRRKPMSGRRRGLITPLALLHRMNGVRAGDRTLSEILRAPSGPDGRFEATNDRGLVRLKFTLPRVTYPEGLHGGSRPSAGPAPPPERQPPAAVLSTETMTVTLDPKYGYLPREVKTEVGRHVVTEFKFLEGPGIWVPVKGTFTRSSGNERAWEIKDVEVNAELDEYHFLPPIPEGTPIKEGGKTIPYEDPVKKAREQARMQRIQWWLAWIVGILFAAAAVWMCVRIVRNVRSTTTD